MNTDSLVAASEMNNEMMYPNCSALDIPTYVGPNEVREDLLCNITITAILSFRCSPVSATG